MLIRQDSITEMNIECGQPGKDLMSMKEYLAIQKTMINSSWPVTPQGLVSDNSFLGFMVKTANDKFRIQLGGEFDSYIYRGQNKDYDFVPSLQRIDKNNNPEEFCKKWVKKEDFKRFFAQTPYYKRLSQMKAFGNTFDFDLEAVAQHYGFGTDYLDTTTNFNVALYFAYTHTDNNGRTVPITDFSGYSPTLYVAKSCDLCDLDCPIVGFQATLRPVEQSAMAIKVEPKQAIKSRFKKIELPKEPSFAEGIFNSFRKGTILMPDEPMVRIADGFQKEQLIATDLLEKCCHEYGFDMQQMVQKLQQQGYTLTDERPVITEEFICHAHIDISSRIIPWIAENIGIRGSSSNVHKIELTNKN